MARAKKSKAAPVDEMREFLARSREGKITYMLRCCDSQRRAHGGFVWPESGPVEAPDWQPTQECGHGLHGWLMGAGDASASINHSDPNAVWLVCAVFADDAIDLNSKVKVPRAWVTYSGTRDAAVQQIVDLCGVGVVYATATAGARGTATAGDAGTATAGARGTATAGARGTATAGDAGTATAGYAGTATAGARGTATAGEGGIIAIRRWNSKRWRIEVAHVGEDGIEPNRPYRLDDNGCFVRADKGVDDV
jgi:hypothetical protein